MSDIIKFMFNWYSHGTSSLLLQQVVQVAALPAAAAGHHQHPAPRVAQPPARLVGLLRRLVHLHALPLLFPGQGLAERSCLVPCSGCVPSAQKYADICLHCRLQLAIFKLKVVWPNPAGAINKNMLTSDHI